MLNVLLGGELQIHANKLKLRHFWERPLYEIWEYALWFIYHINILLKLNIDEVYFIWHIDAEAPTFNSCPGNQDIEVFLNQSMAVAVWDDPVASDNSELNPTLTCSFHSGSQFGIGKTDVVCQAVDDSGNNASCVFTVNVTGKDPLLKHLIILPRPGFAGCTNLFVLKSGIFIGASICDTFE